MARDVRELQGAGLSISIDDFATGHSSLACLRSLPIDVPSDQGQGRTAAVGNAREKDEHFRVRPYHREIELA